jgi:Fe-S-cluster containining protein
MVDGTPDRFFEWDYDNGVVVEYERLGECNGCGACCMAVIQFAVAGRLNGSNNDWATVGNGGPATSGKGVWSEIHVGGKRRFFQIADVDRNANHRCENLAEDNRCTIQQSKPLFHKAWPMSPRQVTPFELCSYSFREIARWPLEIPQTVDGDEVEVIETTEKMNAKP